MKPLTIEQIRQAVGGKALTRIPPETPPLTSVCTDTRHLESGCLFVALKGDNHDAHNYLPQAAAGGAIAALVEDAPEKILPNVHLIQVPNTRTALGKLATFVRQQMNSKVIGVAGSNGKTSTKHLINAALCRRFHGSISPKSFNNDIGVPLTIFPADPLQDYLVLEMGTNHPGEIRVLTEMARPDIAVITNCGPEHLEFLGDLMGVRQENASIIKGLDPQGLLAVNGDDPELIEAVSQYPRKRIVTFGFKESNDLFASNIECSEHGVRFFLNRRWEVFVPLLGRHTACNSLAAIAVARRFGLSEEEIIEALSIARGPEMRLQMQHCGGVDVLNDAYNANPASMTAALETVKTLPAGRRIAILGDMRELGRRSDEFHREIGHFAATLGLDMLICVGEKARLMAEAAKANGMKGRVRHYPDGQSAVKPVLRLLTEGDLVLLKASRAMRLEEIAKAIAERRAHAHRRRVAS